MHKLTDIKKGLYQTACRLIGEKLDRNRSTLSELKESAGSETKSSAGDKHETGRAMVHLEQEKAVKQMANNQALQNVLDKIDVTLPNQLVSIGSLVITNKLCFFISVPLGKLNFDGQDYFLVSLTSPFAKSFVGKQRGERVFFNGQEYLIEEIL